MSNGEKMNIQDVKVGMEVISWNEETKNQEYSKVTETIISSNTALVTIKTDSGIKITCTREHPFWIKESSGWIQAMLLERGDIVTLEDGKSETIISVETNKVTDTPVYNLHISDNHTYYANSVLVHNKNIEEDVIYTGTTAQQIVSELQQIFGYSYDNNPNSGYYN
jgi:intein/homing endonuclease